ncbi:hypothetical protein ScPMuIL_014358 [Solemya velum]
MQTVVRILLLLTSFSGIVLAQNECPEQLDVASIVAASVFGTLAVVLLVVGIILLFLWRRNKARKAKERTNQGETKVAYTNAGFKDDSALSPNLSAVEEGAAKTGYVPCKDVVLCAKKSPVKPNNCDDSDKKTWASLPKADLPGGNNLQRHSSAGSLDNYTGVDPEVISVWLQSQDFIGLGFNIAGSMRDGIFVSQVHNRGPAIESGRFKVGDRIKSVTISFENMVFEDALTILSYASPYPVKVALQKEKFFKDRRLSDSSMQINHPIYRSQSLDALLKIGKEPIFKPQRSLSEMRSSGRKSETIAERSPIENNSANHTPNSSDLDLSVPDSLTDSRSRPTSNTFVEVTVHSTMATPVENHQHHADNEVSTSHMITDDIKHEMGLPPNPSPVPEANLELENEVDGDSSRVRKNSENTFKHDMDVFDGDIAVSYGAAMLMSTPKPTSQPPDELDSETNSNMPIKPIRTKKRASLSSSSPDESETSQLSSPVSPSKVLLPPNEIILESDIQPSSVSLNLSEPDPAVEEEILVSRKSRKGLAYTDEPALDISETTDQKTDMTVSISDISKTLVDYSISMSDLDSTIRPIADDIDVEPVEENVITAVKIDRDAQLGLAPPTRVQGTAIDSDPVKDNENEIDNGGIQMRDPKTTDENFNTDKRIDEHSRNERPISEIFDIPMEEIQEMEIKIQTELRNSQTLRKSQPQPYKKGIAFEVRDDLVTGFPLNTDEGVRGSVIRAISSDTNFQVDHLSSTSPIRGGSLKQISTPDSDRHSYENPLDWSGKRLVRSGSFSEIPQDSSTKDWTDHNAIGTGGVVLVDVKDNNTSEYDIDTSEIFASGKHLTNMSDLSDSLRSDSSGSSGTSSPLPPLRKTTNGNDTEMETVIDLSTGKSPAKLSDMSTGIAIEKDKLEPVAVTVSTKDNYTVLLGTQSDDDADC